MSDFTPRANLRLPGGGSTGTILPDEQVDIDVLNDNFRKIDALLGVRNIPSASSYSGSMDGDLVYARDTEFLHMFSQADGRLITPRLPGSTRFKGTTSEMSAFVGAQEGDSWFNTTNNSEYVRTSAGWREVPNLDIQRGTSVLTSVAMVGYQAPIHWSSTRSVTFPVPYSSPPTVQLTLGKDNQIIWAMLSNVSATGFEYRVMAVTNAVLPSINVFWLATKG